MDPDGIIWCRPPSFARFSYWRDDVRTRAAWRDGAFTVGDLGRLDDDGYLHLDGRRDDLIITGGVNVYPLEVERALLDHPDVRDAVVFPVADERWGQMVCAAVVGPVDEASLRDHLESRLAAYKRPKRWLLVEALPHSPTGKLRRSTLAVTFGLSSQPAPEAGAGNRRRRGATATKTAPPASTRSPVRRPSVAASHPTTVGPTTNPR